MVWEWVPALLFAFLLIDALTNRDPTFSIRGYSVPLGCSTSRELLAVVSRPGTSVATHTDCGCAQRPRLRWM